MLTKLLNTIKNLFRFNSTVLMDEEYLAGAVDIYDLENRMKKLERGTHFTSGLNF